METIVERTLDKQHTRNKRFTNKNAKLHLTNDFRSLGDIEKKVNHDYCAGADCTKPV